MIARLLQSPSPRQRLTHCNLTHSVTITFDESVTGFVVGDLTVAGATPGSFSGSGTTYTVNLTPSGSGTVTLDIAASVATDAAGNGNAVATQFGRVYDVTAAGSW